MTLPALTRRETDRPDGPEINQRQELDWPADTLIRYAHWNGKIWKRDLPPLYLLGPIHVGQPIRAICDSGGSQEDKRPLKSAVVSKIVEVPNSPGMFQVVTDAGDCFEVEIAGINWPEGTNISWGEWEREESENVTLGKGPLPAYTLNKPIRVGQSIIASPLNTPKGPFSTPIVTKIVALLDRPGAYHIEVQGNRFFELAEAEQKAGGGWRIRALLQRIVGRQSQ